jgi:hypothetical protein
MLIFLFVLITLTVLTALVTISLSLIMLLRFWRLEVYSANLNSSDRRGSFFKKLKISSLGLLQGFFKIDTDISIEKFNSLRISAINSRKYFGEKAGDVVNL